MLHIKKALQHPKADAVKRQLFQQDIEMHKANGRPIVYLDENGFAHDMPRPHGYAERGKRCYGLSDWGAKGRTNVIGALFGATLLTISLFPDNINSNIFHAWIEQDLIPKLPKNAVIVMDNATFHKRQDTRELIFKAGHIIDISSPILARL